MIFNLDFNSLVVGMVIMFCVVLVIFIIFKLINKNKSKTTLKQMKQWNTEAYNNLVEASNNLIKLNKVFEEINNERA